MYSLFLVLFLQQGQIPVQSITSPTTPTIPKSVPNPSPKPTLQLGKQTPLTYPASSGEEAIHLGMEKDISGQGEAVGKLKEKVRSLEEQREKSDRPDIDDLKESRSHFIWWAATIATVLATTFGIVWKFREIIWEDVALKRLRTLVAYLQKP